MAEETKTPEQKVEAAPTAKTVENAPAAKTAEKAPVAKAAVATASSPAARPARRPAPRAQAASRTSGGAGGGQRRSGGGGRRGRRPERPKPDFDQKILNIRRVTRVMAGGRRFSFSVLMAIGDKKGKVGVGLGKASDTSLAIQKSFNNAKKNMVKLSLNSDFSIGHTVSAKFNSAKIELRPNYGRGVVAGSALRTIIELAGMKDITGKVQSRSKNKLNNARATILALEPFISERGVKVSVVKKPADSESKSRFNSSRDRGARAPRGPRT